MSSYRKRQETIDFGLKVAKLLVKGPLTMNEIAAKMGMRRSQVQGMCYKLSTVGVVRHQLSDRRGDNNKRLDVWYLIADSRNLWKIIPYRFSLYGRKGGALPRKKIRVKLGPEIIEVKMTTRKCRDCECLLPESRYFKCFDCQPELPSFDDGFLYHGADISFLDDSDTGDDDDFFSEDIAAIAKQVPKEDLDE